jgi:hypothetical protein
VSRNPGGTLFIRRPAPAYRWLYILAYAPGAARTADDTGNLSDGSAAPKAEVLAADPAPRASRAAVTTATGRAVIGFSGTEVVAP